MYPIYQQNSHGPEINNARENFPKNGNHTSPRQVGAEVRGETGLRSNQGNVPQHPLDKRTANELPAAGEEYFKFIQRQIANAEFFRLSLVAYLKNCHSIQNIHQMVEALNFSRRLSSGTPYDAFTQIPMDA